MTERHSDPFFESVRNELYHLEVAPPESAYVGMRKRMSSKTGWFSMNTLAAAVILGAMVAGTLLLTNEDHAQAEAALIKDSSLDAAMNTAQSRLQDRDQMLDRQTVKDDEQNRPLQQTSVAATSNRLKDLKVQSKEKDQHTLETLPTAEAEAVVTNHAAENSLNETSQAEIHTQAEQQQTAWPVNWSDQLGTVNPQEILQQVNDANDVIHLSIPVRVSVEDKD